MIFILRTISASLRGVPQGAFDIVQEGGDMKDTTEQSAFQQAAGSMPGMAIASTGIALALYAYEANRMSSFQEVGSLVPGAFIHQLAVLVLLLALLAIYHCKPSLRIHRTPVVGFLIVLLHAIASLYLSNNGWWLHFGDLELVANVVRSFTSVLLIACWIEVMLPSRARNVAVLLAISFGILGGTNIASTLLKADAARVFVALLPLVSMVCLYWYKDHRVSPDAPGASAQSSASHPLGVDRSLALPEEIAHPGTVFILSFIAPLALFTFSFGNVHYNWVPAQDGAIVSMSIQLAAGLGTVLSGFVLYALVAMFWGRRKLELYFFIALPILLMALYLAALVDKSLSFTYVIPLNIAQKLVMFVSFMAPYLAPKTIPPMTALMASFCSYQLGKTIANFAYHAFETSTHTVAVIFAVAGVLACITIALFASKTTSRAETTTHAETLPKQNATAADAAIDGTNSDNRAANNSDAPTKPREAHGSPDYAEEPSANAPSTAQTEAQRRIAACSTLAELFQLTRREEEVLQLLSEGMNAQAVAETLVVSTSTAKSHMRNIYAKLDIHTQNELIILVHDHMSNC